MSWKATLIAVLVSVGLIGALAAGFGRDPHKVPFGLQGEPAPPFVLEEIGTGEKLEWSEVEGQPLVVNFWASWCGPCRADHPVVEWGARTYGDRARFIGVVFEDTEQNARRWLRQLGSGFAQHLDPSSRMAVDWGVSGVPETYFIDAQGVIRGKYNGPLNPESLRRWIDEIAPPGGARASTVPEAG